MPTLLEIEAGGAWAAIGAGATGGARTEGSGAAKSGVVRTGGAGAGGIGDITRTSGSSGSADTTGLMSSSMISTELVFATLAGLRP